MAEGGFDDMEMEERNFVGEGTGPYRENSDSKLQEEYDDLEKKRHILLDDFRGVDFPDDVRVVYDSVEDRLVLIESEHNRRERRDEQETQETESVQEYAFIDDGEDGKTVTIHKREGASIRRDKMDR